MRSKPPKGLFYPGKARQQAQPLIDVAEPFLEEVRDYGLQTFQACWKERPDGLEHVAVLLAYRRFLEMLDGVIVLLNAAAEAPARLQARALFEALLTIEFMLQEDTVRRGHAYILIGDLVDRRRKLRQGDPTTPEGKDYRAIMASSAISAGVVPPEIKNAARLVEEIDAVVSKPPFKEVDEEYTRYKSAHKGQVFWYQLFDGPTTIVELARRLKRGDLYESLYRIASGTIHVHDAVRAGLDQEAVRPIRGSGELIACTVMTSGLANLVTSVIQNHYTPKGVLSFSAWYKRVLAPLQARVKRAYTQPEVQFPDYTQFSGAR